MARGKLQDLLADLNSQITKSERITQENSKTSEEVTKASSASWSAGGDVLYAEGQARITRENLERLKSFRDKIKKELEEPVPETITPTCFVTVKYENLDSPSSFYFVDSPVYVAGLKLVTTDSTLGKIIYGRKKGEKLSFKTTNEYGEVDVDLEILSIE
jgi:hypothetical protein